MSIYNLIKKGNYLIMSPILTKIISADMPNSLEKAINTFTKQLADNNQQVIEIKYQPTNFQQHILFTAMIVYH